MGTPLGREYIPYTYMDPLGLVGFCVKEPDSLSSLAKGVFTRFRV